MAGKQVNRFIESIFPHESIFPGNGIHIRHDIG